jgi:hypothetical protein
MKLANLDDRLVVVLSDGVIDVALCVGYDRFDARFAPPAGGLRLLRRERSPPAPMGELAARS